MIAAALLLAAPAPASMELSTSSTKVPEGQMPAFTVQIENRSKEALRLLDLQDGSSWHWCNPHVGWSFVREGSRDVHPVDTPKATQPRCGNVNPIEPGMFRTLAPGRRAEIQGMPWAFTEPLAPGKYRAVFYYEVTDGNPQGVRGEEGISDALQEKYRQLTPLKLRSNEVRFEVVKKTA